MSETEAIAEDTDGANIRQTGEDRAMSIAAMLEEEIVLGRLQPKERLIETDLAARFEVKRHIVRQAIAELERLGLVDRFRNRGAIVKLYRADEVEDINAVRELLEAHAASIIQMPLPCKDLAVLGAIQTTHEAAIAADDHHGVFRANLVFHRRLFSHCGNKALVEAINAHAQKSHAYRSILTTDFGYLNWAADAHRNMIDALRHGQVNRLVTLCREHLAPAKNKYIETWKSRYE